MDLLDRVAVSGRDLLGRVDSVLMAGGAPADHAIWPLLRRLGALPGDVLESFLALRPAPLLAAGSAVRRRAEAYVEERADLAAAVAATHWEGDSAAEFAARWRVLGGHLGEQAEPEAATLAGRLAGTASYVEDVARWVETARRDLAGTIAEALGSIEAVHLHRAGGGATAGAAAGGAFLTGAAAGGAFLTGAAAGGASLTGAAAGGASLTGAAAGSGVGADPAAVLAAASIGTLVLQTAIRQADDAEAVAERWAGRLADVPFHAGTEQVGPSGTTTRVAL
jgi:hypothetical protein